MVWSRQESLLARQNRHAVRMRYRTGADAERPAGGDGRRHPLRRRRLRPAQRPRAALLDDLRRRPLPLPERADPGAHRLHEPHPVQRHARLRRHAGGVRLRGPDGPARRASSASIRSSCAGRNFVAQGRHAADRPGARDRRRAPGADRRASRSGWGRCPSRAARGRAVGRGFACNLQPYGRCIWLNDWSSAWIGFELDGTLVIRIAVPDIGGGQASSLIQIASEVLGVAPGADHDPHRRLGAHPAGRHDHGHPPALHVRQRRAEGVAGAARRACRGRRRPARGRAPSRSSSAPRASARARRRALGRRSPTLLRPALR